MAINTPTLLDTSTNAVNVTSFESGTVSPTANALLVMVVHMRDSGTSPHTFSADDTFTGTGAWTNRGEIASQADGDASVCSILTAQAGASPGSGTVTTYWSLANNRGVFHLFEITGHDETTPVVQTKTGSGTATTLSLTLDSTPETDSIVIGAISQAYSGAIDPGTNYTELVETAHTATPDSSRTTGEIEYDLTPTSTTVDWSSLNTYNNVAVAIEIAAASSGSDDLTADGIIVNSEVDGSTIGQTHQLTSTPIKSDISVESPTLGQTHILDSLGLVVNSEVESPTLAESHSLVTTDLEVNSEVESSTLGQTHILDTSDLEVDSEVDSPTLGQTHILNSLGLDVSSEVESPTLTESHSLGTTDLEVNSEVESPTLGQTHILDTSDLEVNSEVESPLLSETPTLVSLGILIAIETESSIIGQEHILSNGDILVAPIVDGPTLGEVGDADLTATPISVTTISETPQLGQLHSLFSESIQITPIIETTTLTSHHILISNGIAVATKVETVEIGQTHTLSLIDTYVRSTVGAPLLQRTYDLEANSIYMESIVGGPAFVLLLGLVKVKFEIYKP